MAQIVAARFETFDAAKVAASRLMDSGVPSEHLNTFFVNPAGSHDRYPMGGDHAADSSSVGAPSKAFSVGAIAGVIGAVIGGVVASVFNTGVVVIVVGAGVGAYIGSLAGAMGGLGSRPRNASIKSTQEPDSFDQNRTSGVMLAVNVDTENQTRVAQILRETGGIEVERARGTWRDGKWEDFDPLISPHEVNQSSTPML